MFSGTRRVPGLYERTNADGSTVFEAFARFGGKLRRHTLTATTKTDAIAELRALKVDYSRGEQHRSSPAAALAVADVVPDWLAQLESRVGHRDPRRRYSARTVALYRDRSKYIVRELGHRPIAELSIADVRRFVDRLPAKFAPSTATGHITVLSASADTPCCGNGLLDRDLSAASTATNVPALVGRRTALPDARRSRSAAQPHDRRVPARRGYLRLAGLRVSEALGLRWRDIDFANDSVTVAGQLGLDGDRVPTKTAQCGDRPDAAGARSRTPAHSRAEPSAILLSFTATPSCSRQGATSPSPAVTLSVPSTLRVTRPDSTVTTASLSAFTTSGIRSSRSRSTRGYRWRRRQPFCPARDAVGRRRSTPVSPRAGGSRRQHGWSKRALARDKPSPRGCRFAWWRWCGARAASGF